MKKITVQTNDHQQKNLTLVVKGFVKKFATIRPKQIQLNGMVGDTIRQSVAIIPEKAYPFKITESSARQGTEIDFSLNETKGNNGTAYELTVENKRQKKGRYHDIVVLKTDSPLKPELRVRIYGDIRPAKEDSKPASEDKASSPSAKSPTTNTN